MKKRPCSNLPEFYLGESWIFYNNLPLERKREGGYSIVRVKEDNQERVKERKSFHIGKCIIPPPWILYLSLPFTWQSVLYISLSLTLPIPPLYLSLFPFLYSFLFLLLVSPFQIVLRYLTAEVQTPPSPNNSLSYHIYLPYIPTLCSISLAHQKRIFSLVQASMGAFIFFLSPTFMLYPLLIPPFPERYTYLPMYIYYFFLLCRSLLF